MQKRLLKRASFAISLALSLSLPAVANANAGLPMIFVIIPILGWAIVPIILAEGAVLGSVLPLEKRRAYLASTLANAFSTLVGIPLTWGLLVGLQLLTGGGGAYGIVSPLQKLAAVTWQGAWLIPYEDHSYWMVPSASLFLTIPFFLVSYWSERVVCTRFLRDQKRDPVRRAVFLANSVTYGALALLSLLWLGWSIRAAG